MYPTIWNDDVELLKSNKQPYSFQKMAFVDTEKL